jgi:hypothetical protein
MTILTNRLDAAQLIQLRQLFSMRKPGNRMLQQLFAPSVSSRSPTSPRKVLGPPLGCPKQGITCHAVRGAARTTATKVRNLVSHHFVLDDVCIILPGSSSPSLAAGVSIFSQAVSGAAERSCARNELNPNTCLVWQCQHWSSLRSCDEMHGYGDCRVRVSVHVTIDDHRQRAG